MAQEWQVATEPALVAAEASAPALLDDLCSGRLAPRDIRAPLPAAVAGEVVEGLKQEADRHWWINANRSLDLADMIVQIGRLQGDARQIALGVMARGDALKLL